MTKAAAASKEARARASSGKVNAGEIDQLAAMRAELETLRAEKAALEARVAAKVGRGSPRRAEWMRAAVGDELTGEAGTALGLAQRQDRENLCYTVQKVLRAVPNWALPKLLEELTAMAVKDGGMSGELTADKLLAEAMTRTARGPRAKTLGESPEAGE